MKIQLIHFLKLLKSYFTICLTLKKISIIYENTKSISSYYGKSNLPAGIVTHTGVKPVTL